jgi:CBS domain-containing protein
MNVATLMKRPVVSLHANVNLDAAWACMEENGIRHLPIVDATGHLDGIVTQRDLVRARELMRAAEGRRQPLRVGDIMTTEIVRATPELPAHEAAAMMIEHKIGMLPVVEADGRIVGVVTATDFLEVAREALAGIAPERRARA